MEREILFRGKRLDNGKWAFGTPLYYSGQVGIVKCTSKTRILPYDGDLEFHFIEELFSPKVDPATVGQYTGLTDKNGQKIFNNDIMSFSAYGYDYIGIVSFINGSLCIYCDDSIVPFLNYAIGKYGAEVIGNIHDNPELLEVQNETAD